MLSTSARLLRLAALLQARDGWSGPALAERLGVDARTVRRDIERLRELGYAIDASGGVGGGYRLRRGADLAPMRLDDDEAVALGVALRVASSAVAGIEDVSLRVLGKLESLLPQRLRDRAVSLHAMTVALDDGCQPRVSAARLAQCAAACRGHRLLAFDYRSAGGIASRRCVEPLRLANAGRRWYLVGWDRAREDWRTFRVDRIVGEIVDAGRFWASRSLPDVAAYVLRSISQAPYRHCVRVRLHGAATVLAERVPAWCGVLEAEDEHSCVLSVSADSVEMLVAHLTIPGIAFTLIDDGGQGARLQAVVQRLATGLSTKPGAEPTAGPADGRSASPVPPAAQV